MTAKELLESCTAWNGSKEEFATIVAASIECFGATQRELAEEFEVGESTVSRWANGVARPHPRLQRLVVSYVRRRADRVLKASLARTSSYPPSMPAAVSR